MFLGYVVSPEGVAMDDHKVQSVLNWPKPMIVKEMQRFLGLLTFTDVSSETSAPSQPL